jgi:hypothetical protein
LHLVIRACFSPNDPVDQAKHFAAMTQDIGPWLTDYAAEIEKPAIDFTLDFTAKPEGDGEGGLQQ